MNYEDIEKEVAKALIEKVKLRVAPPPRLTISEWASKYRKLSRESSAAPGGWDNKTTPYLIEIMDAITNPRTQEIIIQAASQVGKSEVLLNTLGYFIHIDPSPILLVFPNQETCQMFSKDRVAPMLRDCGVLKDLIEEPKSRDSSNTISHKRFSGGNIDIVTALSPSALASRIKKIVLLDEFDRFPSSTAGEGDPLKLAARRQDTFAHSRKMIVTSTPTDANTSKINKLYMSELSRRYVYYAMCKGCKQGFEMSFSDIIWEGNDYTTARYVCPLCASMHTDAHKRKMISDGYWKCETPDIDVYRMAYKIPGLCSPWLSFEKVVKEYLDARNDPESFRAFTNTILGEVFEENIEAIDPHWLYDRREEYTAEVPEDVLCITQAIDIQSDRAEIECVGWAEGKRSYSLCYQVVPGDPFKKSFWNDLSHVLERTFTHESGIKIGIDMTMIDSGFATNEVYAFVKENSYKGTILAIKGVAGRSKPIISHPSRQKTGVDKRPVPLYTIGVDEAKNLVYSMLQRKDPQEEGYCHFPKDDGQYPKSYFKQLTSERIKITYKNGYAEKKFIKPEHQANEALDLRVYNVAAITLINPVWSSLKRRMERLINAEKNPVVKKEEMKKQNPKYNNFVNSWRL